MKTHGGLGHAERAERIEFWRPSGLPGVRGLSVDHSWHRWSLFHESWALTFVRGGHGAWRYRRRGRAIEPRSLMLIEPGNVHVTTTVNEPAAFDTLFIDPMMVAGVAERCGLPRGATHFSTTDNHDADVVGCFGHLIDTLRDPHADGLEQSEALEDALYTLFGRTGESAPPLMIAPRATVLRARDLIHDLFADGGDEDAQSTTAFARAVGLTPIQLIRGFNQVFGMPPHQYLVRLRVARALSQIAQGPTDDLRSLADVALDAGFFDLPHMNRVFGRILRTAPSAFAVAVGARDRWARARRGRP
jgi:AraC-like DNA-binding protein